MSAKDRRKRVRKLMAKRPLCFVCGKPVSVDLPSGHPDRATLWGKNLSCRHCLTVFDRKRTIAIPIEKRWETSGRPPKADPVEALLAHFLKVHATPAEALRALTSVEKVASTRGRDKNRQVIAAGIVELRRAVALEQKGRPH